MAEDMIDWKPMNEDFERLTTNSYESGQTAGLLPSHSMPSSSGNHSSKEEEENIKLYLEGFPSDLSETGLKNFLNRIGSKYLWLKLFRKEFGQKSRSFAFIECKTLKEAQTLVQVIKNQKIFRLFVCITSTEEQQKRIKQIKDKEVDLFHEEAIKQNNQMKPEESDHKTNESLNKN